MKCLKIVLFFVVSAGCVLAASESNGQVTFDKSVFMIRIVKQDYNYTTPWKQTAMNQGVGSGFIISGNRILTNAHNVSNQRYIELKKQNLAKRYIGRVEFVGHDCDLAIITTDDASFFEDCVPLEIGGIPKVNSTVQTYGFPIGGKQLSVTEGIVSRVQMSIYSHSQSDNHLVVQTDAAINPGNSGGPVIQEGKVVGVAFQGLMGADNIGFMIPTTVIQHFLDDISDGKYDGFGSLGFVFYPGLHSKSYADYLKVPQGKEGVVVLRTQMNSSIENILQAGDVLTRIGEYDVDNDGMINIYGLTLSMGEAIEQKQIGDAIEIAFYRGGELHQATGQVALNRPILDFNRRYDKQPKYEVFAGLTFVPLCRNFLETWGQTWITNIPHTLRYLFINSDDLNTDRDRSEYVVLAEILDDEVNSYCQSFKNKVVEAVNGVEIRAMADLSGAFGKSEDGFCRIKFMGSDMELIIDSEKGRQRHEGILQKYEVPAASNPEGRP